MQHGQGIDTIIFSLRGRIIRVVKESFYVTEYVYTVYRFLTPLTISAGSNTFHENSLLATEGRRLRAEITLKTFLPAVFEMCKSIFFKKVLNLLPLRIQV